MQGLDSCLMMFTCKFNLKGELQKVDSSVYDISTKMYLYKLTVMYFNLWVPQFAIYFISIMRGFATVGFYAYKENARSVFYCSTYTNINYHHMWMMYRVSMML